jgi:hypothetical protein
MHDIKNNKEEKYKSIMMNAATATLQHIMVIAVRGDGSG